MSFQDFAQVLMSLPFMQKQGHVSTFSNLYLRFKPFSLQVLRRKVSVVVKTAFSNGHDTFVSSYLFKFEHCVTVTGFGVMRMNS